MLPSRWVPMESCSGGLDHIDLFVFPFPFFSLLLESVLIPFVVFSCLKSAIPFELFFVAI